MRSRLNRIYSGMKERCYSPNFKYYKNYGGRGIKICDEWLNPKKTNGRFTKGFLSFKNWALANGYADNLTIDRIDNSKGYTPENCRWVTCKEQANNRRSNHIVAYKGKAQSISKWCEELGLNYDRVLARFYKHRWTIKQIFETKEKASERLITYKGKTQSISAWARELGIKKITLFGRLKRYHWSVEKAFETKIKKREQLIMYRGKTQSISAWAKELNVYYTTFKARLKRFNYSLEKVVEKYGIDVKEI